MPRFIFSYFLATISAIATPYGLVPAPDSAPLPDGIPTVRTFPTWETLQPTEGKWDFTAADRLVADTSEKNIRIVGRLHQLAPWATDGTDSNRFPLENKDAWREYVSKLFSRYKGKITQWDVLDSYNLAPRQTATPFHYVELLTIAREAALKIDPEIRIGFVLADYDLEFLDSAIRDGAAGQFDYISLSPYEYQAGSSLHFKTLLPSLRTLLASHKVHSVKVHLTLTGENEELATAAPLALDLGFDEVFVKCDPATLRTLPTTPPEGLPVARSFADAEAIGITLGKTNESQGIIQLNPATTAWDEETSANRLRVSATPPQVRSAFLADPTHVTPDDNEIEITVTARRLDSKDGLQNPTGLALTYESVHGIRNSETWWTVPGENKWHTHTWKIEDAAFNAKLGWNFRLDAAGAGKDVLIREVKISK